MNIEETIDKYLNEKQNKLEPEMKKLVSTLSPLAKKKGYDKSVKKKSEDSNGDEHYFINTKSNEFVMVSLYTNPDDDRKSRNDIWVSWGRGDVLKNNEFDFAGDANDYYDSFTLAKIKGLF